MAVKLGTNIASTRAQRRLSNRTYSLTNRLQRITSGSRLNKGSDDAAGLSIAKQLKSDVSVYRRGILNLNDGISTLNLIDSAFAELSQIVTRQIELAQQAANGVFSPNQRIPLDTESRLLTEEFNRIVATTRYNNIGLLDGTLTAGLTFQGGYGVQEAYTIRLGEAAATQQFVGDGTFDTGSPLAVSTSGNPTSVATADYDLDGDLDIVVNRSTSSINQIFLNDGNGNLSAGATFASSNNSIAVASGDFNSDGNADFVNVVYNPGPPARLRTSIGDGAGSFPGGTQQNIDPPGNAIPTDVITVDLNPSGDSFDDVLVGDSGNNEVVAFLSNGTGGFTSRAAYAVGGTPLQVVAGDLFGTSDVDFVAALGGGGFTYAAGSGGTSFGGITTLNPGVNISTIALADFDGDGDRDLLAGGTSNGNVYFFANNGSGFSATPTNVLATGGGRVTDIKIGDFNGDGSADVVTTDNSSNTTFVGLGDGAGGFSAAPTSFASGTNPRELAIGDFNGDGISDIFVANSSGNSNVFLGNSVPASASSASSATTFFVSDIDLTNPVAARNSLDELQERLNKINIERGAVGSLSASLETAIRNLGTRTEGFAAAQSRIEDADLAEEISGTLKDAIGEEVASAVVGQANQSPELAVQLIQQS